MIRTLAIAAGLALALGTGLAVPTLAADHLFNSSHSPGVDHRGFANPITDKTQGNASNVSNGNDAPGTGDPKVGEDTGHPSVEVDALNPKAQEHVPFGE